MFLGHLVSLWGTVVSSSVEEMLLLTSVTCCEDRISICLFHVESHSARVGRCLRQDPLEKQNQEDIEREIIYHRLYFQDLSNGTVGTMTSVGQASGLEVQAGVRTTVLRQKFFFSGKPVFAPKVFN